MRVIRIIEYKAEGEKGKEWLKRTLLESHLTKFPNFLLPITGCSIRLVDEIVEKEEGWTKS